MPSESSADNDQVIEAKVDAPVDQLPDAKPAESSPAESGEKGDMLSAVKAALKPTEKSPNSDEQGSKPDAALATDAKKEGADEGDGSADLAEEELAKLHRNTRKRIEFLSTEVKARETKLAEIEPKAQNFDAIQRFVDEAGLSKDDVNQGFDVMKNLKTDPLKAYEQLKPIYAQLQQMAGDVLSPELQQSVDRGEITQAHARELAFNRSRAAVNGQRLEETTTRQRADNERREFEGQVNDVASAVTAWETTTSKNDPDWKLKQPRIQVLVENEILRKQARDPKYFPSKDEALTMSKQALKDVEAEFKRLAPARRSISQPAADAGSSHSAPVPKTMLDAVKVGLERARAS